MPDVRRMNSCPVCHLPYDEAMGEGPCPRCSLAGALALATAPATGDDYEFLAELGRGGMGIVSLARQRSLDRLVALKVIAAGAPGAETRLQREARAAAAIQHPHVVAIHEVGRGAAGIYIAMEYCEGGDLRAHLRHEPLAPRRAAGLVAKLAKAVACAHEAGVLHRDLKPANVMLTAAGEPKLTDFGLSASVAGTAGELTRTGEIAGSPSYLPPEALRAGTAPAPAADIYGLGAILYECVTGRPPFTGDSPAAVLAQIPTTEPVTPRKLNPAVPRDLETIVLKCLEKNPAARYASARALHEDLQAYLAGHPISARPVSPLGRGWRWAARNPALAAALGFIFVGSIVAALLLAERNQRLRGALAQSEEANAQARSALQTSLINQAHTIRLSGRQGQRYETLELLRRAAETAPPDPRIADEALAALALDDWRWGPERHFPQLSITQGVSYNSDLSQVVVPNETGNRLLVIELATGRELRAVAAEGVGTLRDARLHDDGWIEGEFADGTMALWGPGDVAPRWQQRPAKVFRPKLYLRPDRQGWWYTGEGDRLTWREAASGRESHLGAADESVYGMALSPDGNWLAVVRNDLLECWDLRGAEPQRVWTVAEDVGLEDPVWTRDGRHVVTEHFVGTPDIVLWRLKDGAAILRLHSGNRRNHRLATHPDGRRLFSIDSDSILRVWDLSAGRELLQGQAGPHALTVSADGRRLGVAATNQKLAIAELAPLDVLRPLTLRPRWGALWRQVAISPDGRRLIGQKYDEIRSFDLEQNRETADLDIEPADTTTLTHLNDGRLLTSSAGIGIVALRLENEGNTTRWHAPATLEPPGGFLLEFVDPAARWWFVSEKGKPGMILWPGGDRHAARALGPPLLRSSVQLSHAGKWAVFTAANQSKAWIHAVPDGQLVATLPVDGRALARFSPDDAWLLVGTDRGYTLWATRDFSRPAQQLDFPQPGALYGFSAFAPQGDRLAYMTGLNTVAIARVGTWLPEITFTLPYGSQRDEWVWSPQGDVLYILSARNEAYALRPAAAEAALRELGFKR